MSVHKRVGVILPSTNTTVEADFFRMAPMGVTVHFQRILRKSGLIGDYKIQEEMNREIDAAASMLATGHPDIIAYACTGGSVLKGIGYDQELIAGMKAASGVAAVTTASAVVDALNWMGIKKISIATPYGDDENRRIQVFLRDSGFTVLNIQGDPSTSNKDVSETSEEASDSVRTFAASVCQMEAEALFCACTAWQSLEIVEELEYQLSKPVLTANQVTMWSALRKIGLLQPIIGFGRLFASSPIG